MLKKLLALFMCFLMLTLSYEVQASDKKTDNYVTSYKVSSFAEADAAILDSLNQHASKMILNLKNIDYYDTYDLIIPYTRGLGTYNTHNFGWAVNGGTWTSLEINVKYYTTADEENHLDLLVDSLLPDFESDSDYDKIKAVHDYICATTVYSEKTANNVAGYDYHSAYDALVNHEAVCSGYALLFQKFMEKLNIPSYVYIDDNEVAHAWNIVYLDDNWYQVDCTWDDKAKGYTYENFLKGDNLKGHDYNGDITLATKDYSKLQSRFASNK